MSIRYHITYTLAFLFLSMDSTLCACGKDGIDNGLAGSARLYGRDFHEVGPVWNFPYTGDSEIIEALGKVTLGDMEFTPYIKVVELQLKDVLPRLTKKIPDGSGWKVQLSKDAEELRVTGFIEASLIRSLASFMREGNVYCFVTDGMVEIRKSEVLVLRDFKEGAVDGARFTEMAGTIAGSSKQRDTWNLDGEAKLYGTTPSATEHSGNSGLFLAVGKIQLVKSGDINSKVMTLSELAEIINSRVPVPCIWRVKVGQGAEKIKVSGVIKKDLRETLFSSMEHRKDFHCLVTRGLVEFRAGSGEVVIRVN